MPDTAIRVRGACTHNLQGVDLDLPRGKLIAVCGVSGSGKSSLVVDTIYAEGRRRYVETFSTFARQFLERLERPNVEQIDGLPPPIRIQEAGRTAGRRMTVGTATEIQDLLALLYAELGEVVCPDCTRAVRRDRVQDVAAVIGELPEDTRVLMTFPSEASACIPGEDWRHDLRALGFRRLIAGGRVLEIDSTAAKNLLIDAKSGGCEVVVDRLVAGRADASRTVESLETARDHGGGRFVVYAEASPSAKACFATHVPEPVPLDGRAMLRYSLSDHFTCNGCGRTFLEPTPPLFSFHCSEGACPQCEGLGGVERADSDRAARRKKSWQTCPACAGRRLKEEALAVHVGGMSVAVAAALPAHRLAEFMRELCLSRRNEPRAPGGRRAPTGGRSRVPGRRPVETQILARLAGLTELGIGYLPLARPVRLLSRGERQRVALVLAAASSLTGALYVLDEPTVGLHAADMQSVVAALEQLRDRGNTVLVVEHEEEVLRAAEILVEMGPAAGQDGGQVVFTGTPAEVVQSEGSATGDWLAGRRARVEFSGRRQADHGRIQLVGARSKNLQSVTVEFPLGLLCVVTGVSGAGKSALVEHALYPALRERLGGLAVAMPTWEDARGTGQIDHVELVTQSPPVRSARSNPATYAKAFDAIRRVFAESIDATTRNYGPGFFSFNVEGGRCERCKGEGRLKIDMQFLPDLVMVCPECNGRRYRAEALAVQHRGRTIADVLEMTVGEAMSFFRGERAVQSRLACLKDVGLNYLRLGQPLRTLSGGEVQRLKLASFLQTKRSGRTLFLLDEPTTGLHATDVCMLLDCFDGLLAVGHSIIAVTHSLALVRAADHVIEMGPGGGDEGGRVVACGTPGEIAACGDSVTGQYL